MFRPFRKPITNEMKCYVIQSIQKSLNKPKILTNPIKNNTTNLVFYPYQLIKPLFHFIKALCCYFSSNDAIQRITQ
jgi:hypothetical protein